MYRDAEVVAEDEWGHSRFFPNDDGKACAQVEGGFVGVVDAEVGAPNAGTTFDGVAVPDQSPVGCGGADEFVGRDASVVGGVVPADFSFRNES